MKKILSVAAVSGLLLAGLAVTAGWGQPGAGGQPPAGGDGQPPARGPAGGGGRGGQPGGGRGGAPGLEGSMKGMDRSIENLKASIADVSKKEDNLRLLSDAERFAAGAKGARPTEALNDAKDDAERAKIITSYRKHLLDVLKTLIEAEEATMDGKTDKAKAAIDKVIAIRAEAHKEFKVSDDKKGGEGGGGQTPRAPRGSGGGAGAPPSGN